MWVAQFYPFTKTRQLITSGGLGTMGFGLPAAVGAQLACPDQLVVAVVGDGGFQMTNQELATAVQYNLPVKILIMNNGYLGMVRQWQEMFYDRTYSEVDISVAPDFVKLAEAYGAAGFRATRPDELSDVLGCGVESQRCCGNRHRRVKRRERFPHRPGRRQIANDMIVQNDGA